MNVSIRALIAGVAAMLLFASCGGSSAPRATPTPDPEATPTPFDGAQPTPATPISTVRVAYLNLGSPLEWEEDSPAWSSWEQRLDIAIGDLAPFNADLVGVSEAAWVRELGVHPVEKLVSGLGMEGSILARANPWGWNTSRQESDAAVAELGYEEGEYLLSRHPILESKRYPLPRVSVSEGRAVLHAVVKFPHPVGEVDVYVTRFGGDDRVKEAQAVELVQIITGTHKKERGLVVMGDLGAGPDSTVLEILKDPALGLSDAAFGTEPEFVTCCRANVVGMDEPPAEVTPNSDDTESTPETPDGEATGDVVETETPTEAEQTPDDVAPTMSTRTDFVLVAQWDAVAMRLVAAEPSETRSGEPLYASDHNGVGITFAVGTNGATTQ